MRFLSADIRLNLRGAQSWAAETSVQLTLSDLRVLRRLQRGTKRRWVPIEEAPPGAKKERRQERRIGARGQQIDFRQKSAPLRHGRNGLRTGGASSLSFCCAAHTTLIRGTFVNSIFQGLI
jgi:hypothetical protein